MAQTLALKIDLITIVYNVQMSVYRVPSNRILYTIHS